MAECQFTLYHGWGFDSSLWRHWQGALEPLGRFSAYDRGYFKTAKAPRDPDPTEKSVLISHSYGLHWIGEDQLNRADMLIIVSGFLYFHPYAAQYRRRSRLVMQEMINQFEINPEKVLKKFYQNCFAPQAPHETEFQDLDHRLLLEDLQLLQNAELDIDKLKRVDKICILHGYKDQIVPNKKGRQLYTQLQEHSQYFEIKNAGHALPLTHHRQCIEFIKPEIEQLAHPERQD